MKPGMTESSNKLTAVRTRHTIINLLKQGGCMDAETLASRLSLTAMAVRQHLYALQNQQLVTYREEARPMGRPAKLWQLTSAADRFFPEGYAELTLSLINSMTEAFGEEGLDRLLEVRTRQQIQAYQTQLPQDNPLQQRLDTLAAKRTEEGYMAEIQPLEDGSFLLIENHCPICAVAVACTGFCRKELEVFQTVLGENVAIERIEHVVAGERAAFTESNL
jgi:predicted ArsR family transcriptional regulator